MKFSESDLDGLVESICSSAKYRHVCVDLVRRLGASELYRQSSSKEAVKSTRNRLHQAAGAYLDSTPNYARWRVDLAAAPDDAAVHDLSAAWMRSHVSTRERLPVLDTFYSSMLRPLGTITSVIDIACGLNPLFLPWMGLAPGVRYFAYDLYSDMMAFLMDYIARLGIEGGAYSCDCAPSPPDLTADLALVLKFLPVLEQLEKGSTLEWLKRLNSSHILVSFPTRSLGGRNKQMPQNYEARFLETVSNEPWSITRFEFSSELCFLVTR